jgi:hypothetical protein
MLIFEASFSS